MAQDYVIDYLELPSANGIRSRNFFKEAFGWALSSNGSGYDRIEGVGIGAGINSDAADRAAAPLAVIRVGDLELAVREVQAAGGVVTRPPFDHPRGRRFHFREPGGTELAVHIERA